MCNIIDATKCRLQDHWHEKIVISYFEPSVVWGTDAILQELQNYSTTSSKLILFAESEAHPLEGAIFVDQKTAGSNIRTVQYLGTTRGSSEKNQIISALVDRALLATRAETLLFQGSHEEMSELKQILKTGYLRPAERKGDYKLAVNETDVKMRKFIFDAAAEFIIQKTAQAKARKVVAEKLVMDALKSIAEKTARQQVLSSEEESDDEHSETESELEFDRCSSAASSGRASTLPLCGSRVNMFSPSNDDSFGSETSLLNQGDPFSPRKLAYSIDGAELSELTEEV